MTTDVFIRSFSKDHKFLHYCLASITKFATGFRRTIIVSQEDPTPAEGYLSQMLTKMNADRFTDADVILFTDSDTFFRTPITPETFIKDGKPVWIMTPFKELEGSDCWKAWFQSMTDFAGEEPTHEFMRRHPFVMPRWLLQDFRDWCLCQHGKTIEQYVMEKGTFSEYNAIGHYAWRFHRDKFTWIDSSKDELPPETVFQAWSHDPIEKYKAKIQEILA